LSEAVSRKSGPALPLVLFLATVVSRLPFASTLLYHWDSAHFALALHHYDIRGHQPHPPGYFLYVILGRVAHLLIQDANTAYVALSIVFSGFTVVVVYFLGAELFDKKTGWIAAVLIMTSANFWFHGEVALTYAPEAFFSAAVAFLCWKVYRGEYEYIRLSAFALGIAGGLRQNTIVFLLPLWLFSIRKVDLGKIVISFMVLGVTCLMWFVPMITMTGGWTVYREALREYWVYVIGHTSVMERGLSRFTYFFTVFFQAVFYGIGAGVCVLGLAAYSLVRHRRLPSVDRAKFLFFVFWLTPSVLFFLFKHMSPANLGYVLICMPALAVLSAASTMYLAKDLREMTNKDLLLPIVAILVMCNLFLFFIAKGPTSLAAIRGHDRDLSVILESVKKLDPETTVIFADCSLVGSRHIMFYAPEFITYTVDVGRSARGELRDTFWGTGGVTHVTPDIVLPQRITRFAALIMPADEKGPRPVEGVTFTKLLPYVYLASGPVELIGDVYPEYKDNYEIAGHYRHFVPIRPWQRR
jgi:hypothetical protein